MKGGYLIEILLKQEVFVKHIVEHLAIEFEVETSLQAILEQSKNNELIPVGYTTLAESELIEIQAYIDLKQFHLVKKAFGTNDRTYQECEVLTDEDIENGYMFIEFEDLVQLNVDSEMLINRLLK